MNGYDGEFWTLLYKQQDENIGECTTAEGPAPAQTPAAELLALCVGEEVRDSAELRPHRPPAQTILTSVVLQTARGPALHHLLVWKR